MQTYEYEALDSHGRNRKGYVSADSPSAAHRLLKQKHLLPVRVLEAVGRERTRQGGVTGVSYRDITLFTRQLSTMISASAPVEDALATIGQQTDKPGLKKLVLAVRAGVAEGYKLSEAMALHRKCFSPLYLAVVGAGEQSGALAATLNRLADHQERAYQIRSKVRTALIYPACLAVTALAVVVALMTFVVPKVVDQFASIDQQLPFLTRTMIGLSDLLQAYGLYAAGGLVLAIFIFVRSLRNRGFRRLVDGLLLHMPVVGAVVRDLNASRLARTLATLLGSSVPMLEGLRAAQKTVRNSVLQETIEEVVAKVEEGASLSSALKAARGFPAMVTYMVAAGENSGAVDSMLDKAADYMESEFSSLIATVLSLLEPAIIILMGAIVATIVLSIMLPIMQLNTLAGL